MISADQNPKRKMYRLTMSLRSQVPALRLPRTCSAGPAMIRAVSPTLSGQFGVVKITNPMKAKPIRTAATCRAAFNQGLILEVTPPPSWLLGFFCGVFPDRAERLAWSPQPE